MSNYSFIRLKFSNHATQPKRTAAFEEVLKLKAEPIADCARYDQLRTFDAAA